METPQQQLPYRGAPFPSKWRRNHPRSKNGCMTCRSKRKKCDEAKPVCGGCVRTKQECVWPTPNGDQADRQLASHTEGVLESHFSQLDPSTCMVLAVSQDTTSSFSIRVAPTYGNLAYLSDDSKPLYQQYLDTTAEMLTRGPSECGNPFVNYLLPLAFSNELVMHCVLAIGGGHLLVNNSKDRGLEVATRGHYAKVLTGLQTLLSYEIGQVTPGMVKQTTSTRTSQILLILQLLCIYDHIQGNTRGAIYLHLKASREYITTLTSSSCQPYDELAYLRGFLLEMYAYHAMKLALSPRNMLRQEHVEIDPSVHSLEILDGYKSRGFLLGFGQSLFEMIPQIHQLVEARREEEMLGLVESATLRKQYEYLVAKLDAFDPSVEDLGSLLPSQDRSDATMIYQNALIVYLHSAFCTDMLSDVSLSIDIDERIIKTMPAFITLFLGDSPYRRMLLWPGVIMASCAQREQHLKVFRAGLVGRAKRTPGAIKTGARIVELLWNDPDPRAFGPRGLSYIMTKHDISFGLC